MGHQTLPTHGRLSSIFFPWFQIYFPFPFLLFFVPLPLARWDPVSVRSRVHSGGAILRPLLESEQVLFFRPPEDPLSLSRWLLFDCSQTPRPGPSCPSRFSLVGFSLGFCERQALLFHRLFADWTPARDAE